MEADIDDSHIHIRMFPVEKRELKGEIFRALETDWTVVRQLATQFREETQTGSDPGNFGECGEVWLIQPRKVLRATYELACGVVQMEKFPSGWLLCFWWIHPNQRNNGLSLSVWKQLEGIYGDFSIEAPTSKAMNAFLKKVDPMRAHRIVICR
ncbi:hypothetical protein [Arthrobacter sp. MMS24-S77]